jgi:hypothetical protein
VRRRRSWPVGCASAVVGSGSSMAGGASPVAAGSASPVATGGGSPVAGDASGGVVGSHRGPRRVEKIEEREHCHCKWARTDNTGRGAELSGTTQTRSKCPPKLGRVRIVCSFR